MLTGTRPSATCTPARGVPPRPSAMFLASICCQGCYTLPRPSRADQVQAAGTLSCMACHGPRYHRMFDRWQGVLGERLALARRELDQARGGLRSGHRALGDADANLLLVERGGGGPQRGLRPRRPGRQPRDTEHRPKTGRPPWTALWVLGAARQGRGLPALPAGPGDPQRDLRGQALCPRPHVVDQQLACTTCHRPREEWEPSEVVSMPAQECAPCHHAPRVKTECSRCHTGISSHTQTY